MGGLAARTTVGLQAEPPPLSSVVEAWIAPIRPMLDGIDLSQPVVDAQGKRIPGNRGEHLSRLLAETLMGYSDISARIRMDMSPEQVRVVKPLLDQAVFLRRSAAVRVAKEGVLGSAVEPMEAIELRVFEAAQSVKLGVWG